MMISSVHSPDTPFVTITQEELRSKNAEFFQKMKDSCKLGCFYVEIPKNCEALIKPAVAFANTFYGKTLQAFVGEDRIHAALHRVKRVFQDRMSFGIFTDNNPQTKIYKRNPQGDLENTDETYMEYTTKALAKTL